ncbi:MAG: thymidine phosphorylase [Alphaproteobacteria bacterium]|nr:thymidine phosphorylase [Alphaproteobacteria bacterium]
MKIIDLISKKRDHEQLTSDEIHQLVEGIEDWSISDGQLAAMLMAMYINGLSTNELTNMIREIVDTGMIFDWETMELDGPVASIYSMPGVGDKSEILVAIVLAACGMYIPMLSDKMQYHTGGTLDKLNSISGYATHPSHSKFKKAIKNAGCAFMTSTEQFAPADVRIQSIRDTTATLSSLDLMIISILVKKVASGIHKLTVDLKVGSGSLTKTPVETEQFRSLLNKCCQIFGIETSFCYSDMNQIVGQNIGNALEIYEIWAFLTGAFGPRDEELMIQTKKVAGTVLLHNEICKTEEEANRKIENIISSGKAAEQFSKMLYEMGVSPAFMSNPSAFLPTAPVVKPVYPKQPGTVKSMNLRWIGLSMIEMGAGRLYSEQKIDYSAGYTNFCKLGMFVSEQVPMAFVHACDEKTANQAIAHLQGAIVVE